MLTGRQSLYTIGAMLVLALAAMAAATFLTAIGALDAAAATGIIGTALGLSGAIGAATSQATNPHPPVTATKVTTREGMTIETNGGPSAGEPEA